MCHSPAPHSLPSHHVQLPKYKYCCHLLQIIPTRLHSNFLPKNLLSCLFRSYLHSHQSFHVSRNFFLLLQCRSSLTTLKESRPQQIYPIKLQTNISNLNKILKPLERLILASKTTLPHPPTSTLTRLLITDSIPLRLPC